MSMPGTDILKNRYRIDCRSDEAPAESEPVGWSLGREPDLAALMESFGAAVRSPDRKVTGMLGIKHASALITGALYAWIYHGLAWGTALEDVRAEVEGTSLLFRLPAPSGASEPEAVVQHLLNGWADPLLRLVSAWSGVGTARLRQTVAYNLTYWERDWLLEAQTPELRGRIEEAFRLLRAAAGSSGGAPGQGGDWLSEEYAAVANPYDEHRPVRIRSACCTHFRLPGERYCYTCPLLNVEERMDRLAAAYAAK